MSDFRIEVGDCRELLKAMPDNSAHDAITSPPYFGARRYVGDDDQASAKEIGQEASVPEYVAALKDVFREVFRVLRPDGKLFLNLGDRQANRGGGYTQDSTCYKRKQGGQTFAGTRGRCKTDAVRKDGDLCGIPWLVALALQEDGWILRHEIIWRKRGGLPDTQKGTRWEEDSEGRAILKRGNWRPARRHEHIFLFTKQSGAYFDAHDGEADDVWEFPCETNPQGHIAAFPVALPMRCLRASTSQRGVCPKCGDPLARVVRGKETIGWRPTCDHQEASNPVGAVVLDPFCGSGTTGVAALSLGQRFIGLELSAEYAATARTRLAAVSNTSRAAAA